MLRFNLRGEREFQTNLSQQERTRSVFCWLYTCTRGTVSILPCHQEWQCSGNQMPGALHIFRSSRHLELNVNVHTFFFWPLIATQPLRAARCRTQLDSVWYYISLQGPFKGMALRTYESCQSSCYPLMRLVSPLPAFLAPHLKPHLHTLCVWGCYCHL